VVAEALPATHPQRAVLVAYKQAYEARFKEDVSGFGGYALDALLILEQAAKVGGADREKVRAAVEGLKGFTGTSGLFSFSPADHNGLALDSFELLTVKDGKFAILGAR
jgi:branched-chain amino acid transport system substrate-binding protein